MRKLTLLLALAMLVTLVACGNNDTQTTEPSTESSQSTTVGTSSTTDATDSTENSTGNTDTPIDGTEGTTGATQAPTDEPTTQPPATQPPATQPPTTQPPTTQPPATQPPTTQPSVSNDTTPPVVTSVTLNKTSASIGETINITVAASDESEIDPIRLCFRMSNGKTGNAWTDLYKGADGLFHGSITIDETFVSGRCSFGWMQVDDHFSNSALYSDGNGDYPNIYFDVVGGNNDTTPPVVTSVTLDKTSASIGETINITVAASDESEIDPIRLCFRMSNGQTGNAWTDLYKGADGLFHGSITIDETFVSGRCSFGWMQVDDHFSNSALYSDGNGDYPNIYFDVVQ